MAWWLWVLLGFALVMCELLTPGGFFFLFFGLGAVAVGALVWLGAGGPAWLQWFLFSLISIGFLIPLRGRLLRRWPRAMTRPRAWTRWSARWRCSSTTCPRARSARRSCAARRGTHATKASARCAAVSAAG